MISVDSLEVTAIIVVDHEPSSARQLISIYEAAGYQNVLPAEDAAQLFQLLRPYQSQSKQSLLLVTREDFPHYSMVKLSQMLGSGRNGADIPFILLTNQQSTNSQTFEQAPNQIDDCLLARLAKPVNPGELLLSTHFLLRLQRERMLRVQQHEQLINELAAKNVMDAKLKYLVAHDELTGLLNRGSFEGQLRLILNMSNQLHKQGALLFIDIDRFSLINELEGFGVGDRLLVELTTQVRKLIPSDSLFARIGADEFCLFLENKTQLQAQILGETIKSTIENFRFFTGEVSFSAMISIGIALLSDTETILHPGEMILRARQACNLAKQAGGNRVSHYNQEDQAIQEHRRDIYWMPIIRKALRDNDFFLVFQPVVELNNGNISHYEVLVRMVGENQETITPDKFIPVAERIGLIHAIDLWVVERAIDFLAELPACLASVSLAINLSGSVFQSPNLLQVIRDKLELTWIDAGRLTFEITETAAVDNFEMTRSIINKIRALGCKFALDDFGAGFCSFNYLKMFPVDYVKIDGQFIRNLAQDETDQLLVKSMVEIAGKLGKKTIAEFVESPITALKLKEMGVNLGQGYAFGKPERRLLSSNQIQLSELQACQLLNPDKATH